MKNEFQLEMENEAPVEPTVRERLLAMLREDDTVFRTEEEIAATMATFDRHTEQDAVLESAGVKVSYRKHLDRMSNVRFRGGRLHDGTCHYSYQLTVVGKTYNIKDELKSAGFRWDAADKLWFRKMTAGTIASNLQAGRGDVVAMLAEEK